MGIYIFSIGAEEQKLCPNSSKHGREATKIIEFDFLNSLPHNLYFCLYRKLLFIPFGFVMGNLRTILFFRQLEHLFEKITCRIH